MSHFYGTLQGSRGEATRCGTKHSGVTTVAASWKGCIQVRVWYDEKTKTDKYLICQEPWQGHGISESIASGTLGEKKGGVEKTPPEA